MAISKKICYTSFKEVASKYMDEETIDSFMAEHKLAVKKLQAENSSLNLQKAENIAGAELLTKLQKKALLVKKNKLYGLQKKLEIIDFITTVYKDKPLEGINAFLAGAEGDILAAFRGSKGYVEGSMNSIGSEITVQQSKAVGAYYTDLKESKLFKKYISGELDKNIIEELLAIQTGKKTGKSQSPDSVAIANILNKHQTVWTNKLNDYGADLDPNFSSLLSVSHDIPKLIEGGVKAASKQKWMTFIKPLLNWERMVGSDTPEKFLSDLFDSLLSGKHLDFENPVSEKLATSLAEKIKSKRYLQFKDADGYMAYNTKYGYGNLRESFHYGLVNTASNFALVKRLGTSSRQTAIDSIKDIMKLYSGSNNLSAIESFRTTGLDGLPPSTSHLMAEIFGDTKKPVNYTMAKWAATIRNIESMAKLGMALISSFSDIHNVAYEATFQGRKYHEALGESFTSLYKNLLNLRGPEERRMLAALGVVSDAIPGLIMERHGMDSSVPGDLAKHLQTFFNMNGLRWWTDSLREAQALGMANYLGDHISTKTSWTDLPQATKQILNAYNLGEKAWRVLSKVEIDGVKNKKFLTIESIERLDDNLFEGLNKEDFLDDYRRYIIDRSNTGAIIPSFHEKALWRHGTQPGTIEGEAARMIGQFKSFPISIINKSLNKMIYAKGGANNAFDAFMNGSMDKVGLVNTMITMTSIGYISMTLKDYLKGRNPREFNAEALGLAFIQGGGAGLYGDLIFSDATKYGNKFTDILLEAPAFSLVNDLYTIAKSGKDFMPTLVKRGKNHIPYSNLFWTKPFVDYMIIYKLQEALEPGYLRRMERRIEKDNKQTFYAKPSQISR